MLLEHSYASPARLPDANLPASVPLDDWHLFDRFLHGIEDGAYHAGDCTPVATDATLRCLAADGLRFIARVVDICETGRVPKNDPAIFSLALAAKRGDEVTRRAAYLALPRVCRIPTQLMRFAELAQQLGGWGRGMRNAVSRWYNARPAAELARLLAKYPTREGWSNRDLLRLAHPRAASDSHDRLYGWAVDGALPENIDDESLALIVACDELARTEDLATASALVRRHRIPRSCVPARWLREPEIWDALLPAMPAAELLGELAAMTRVGLLVAGGRATSHVVAQLRDRLWTEVEPMTIVTALVAYRSGRGRNSWWLPVLDVIDALAVAFYTGLEVAPRTTRRTLVALDVSSSMGSGTLAPGLTPRIASAAMAMLADAETVATVRAFTGGFTKISIDSRTRLDDLVGELGALPIGRTDCTLPIQWAMQNGIDVDTFVVYTDDETWAGDVPPAKALRAYRDARGIPAKLVVVGMMSNGFSLADPNDAGMLDVVGFDASVAPVLSDFARA